MGRNREMIRQWTLLQRLATRRNSSIPALAKDLGVTTRTIRRDLHALDEAGFPLYDEEINGAKCWRVDNKALVDALARNALTLPELCALYYSRALVTGVAGANVLTDLQSALAKLEAALPAGVKRFLDRLPSIITAKSAPGRRNGAGAQDVTARLFEALLEKRVVAMRYHSQRSAREKDYTIHPYRLVYAQNALYLQAFVPAYSEVRTFLIDRIRSLSLQEQTFKPVAELGSDPFGKSLGAYSGPTCKVQLRFAPAIAPFIKERIWHESQQLKDRPDGSVVMTLHVSDDYALRQWILGFGKSVRVLAPASLVEWMLQELEEAKQQYVSGEFATVVDRDAQPALPFIFNRIASDAV